MKAVILALSLCFLALSGVCEAGDGSLSTSYYRDSCPLAAAIAKKVTWKRVLQNPNLPAKLLRLHFHDCFVRGCDGSILLNTTTPGNETEKDSFVNSTLEGYDVIDEIKEEIEKVCPATVSCADIVALAARDAVSFQHLLPLWRVPLGRKDGRISISAEAFTLPAPTDKFDKLLSDFTSKGLEKRDLVVLSGAHTLGRAHCFVITNRLYNFTGKGDQDPALDRKYADFLRTKCSPQPPPDATVEMDPKSSLSFDSHYFKNLLKNRGLFESDAALLTDAGAKKTATELTNAIKFFFEFGRSMERMGQIEIKTGKDGEIRRKCYAVNPPRFVSDS